MKAINYFSKKLHLRYLTGSLICLSKLFPVFSALALQCYECNGSNGNSDCVLNPSSESKRTCLKSTDVCAISATYVKPNKSVDYDEKRDLRTMRRLCKGDKSMCNIGVKPWGKCYQTPSETELICETCCRDDLCNTGDLTWKTSNAIQPKGNAKL